MSDSREQIEKTADRIRDELLTTLKELDRRRHDATDLHHQFEAHIDTLVMVGVGAAVLLGVGLGAMAVSRRSKRKHVLKRRARAMVRAWEHPDRLATKAKDRPLPVELGRKVLTTVVMAFATRYAKQFADSVMGGMREPPPERRSQPSFMH